MNWTTSSCQEWTYDFSLYYPTITSDMNWVCGEDWKPAFVQSLFFLGSIIGIPIFGWLADNYGRNPVSVSTNIIACIFGVASSFAWSFESFCVLRFIVGLTFDAHYYTIYALSMEYVSASYRTLVANAPVMLFLSGGLVAVPWVAYYAGHWTTLGLILYAPMAISALTPYFVPESVRWLTYQGRTKEVTKIITRAAKINGKTLPPSFSENFNAFLENERINNPKQVVTWVQLVKTPNLRKRFLYLCVLW